MTSPQIILTTLHQCKPLADIWGNYHYNDYSASTSTNSPFILPSSLDISPPSSPLSLKSISSLSSSLSSDINYTPWSPKLQDFSSFSSFKTNTSETNQLQQNTFLFESFPIPISSPSFFNDKNKDYMDDSQNLTRVPPATALYSPDEFFQDSHNAQINADLSSSTYESSSVTLQNSFVSSNFFLVSQNNKSGIRHYNNRSLNELTDSYLISDNISKKNKAAVNTELYKTELCSTFVKSGDCPYGEKCQFAHGENELKSVDRPSNWRSKPCQNWLKKGRCSYNERCCFRHD